MKKALISLIISLLVFPLVAQGAMDGSQLQALGVKMIDKRAAAITMYDVFLSQTRYISQPTLDKVRLELSRVNGELEELKSKILAETDTKVLKTDVKSIVTNYRVYQVFLPQSAGLVAADRLKTFHAKLDELKNKISEKIDALEDQGKDATDIRNLLTAASEHLNVAQEHISAAEIKFTSMTIADPSGSRALKLDGRTALLNARKDFSEARKNLKDAVLKIKELAK